MVLCVQMGVLLHHIHQQGNLRASQHLWEAWAHTLDYFQTAVNSLLFSSQKEMMVFVPHLWRESGFTEPRMSRRNLLMVLPEWEKQLVTVICCCTFSWLQMISHFRVWKSTDTGQTLQSFLCQHKVNFHTKRQNSVQWSVATASTTVVLFLKNVMNKIQQHAGRSYQLCHFLVLQEGQKGSHTEAEK